MSDTDTINNDTPEYSESPVSSYNYSWQFEKAFNKAVVRVNRKHPAVKKITFTFVFMAVALGLLMPVMVLLNITLKWNLPLPGWSPLLFHLIFWPVFAWYMFTMRKRLDPVRYIITNRLCLNCGYPLRGLPLDSNWNGRCPECGREYNLGDYVHPRYPRKYPLDINLSSEEKDSEVII